MIIVDIVVQMKQNLERATVVMMSKIIKVLKDKSQKSVAGWAVEEDDFESVANELLKLDSNNEMSKTIKDYILEDLEKLTNKELGKVYRYIRTKVIAKL